MKLHFFVRFSTKQGQQLRITGNIPLLGEGNLDKALAMHYYNDQYWQALIEIPESEIEIIKSFTYQYILVQDGDETIMEWGNDRLLELTKFGTEEVQMMDTWNHAGEFDNVFFTEPFRDVLLPARKTSVKPKPFRGNTHVFKIKAPLLGHDEVICLTGSAKSMGSWLSEDAVEMSLEKEWWTLKLNLSKEDFPLTYKYGIKDTKTGQFVRYEGGNNRVLFETKGKKKITILHDGFAQLPNNIWRAAGIAIPVFSIRTHKSFGVGEFADIPLLADWAKKLGMRMIQILPVNDTITTHTWQDSYPYSAISAFALHPIYLNLEKVAGKDFADSIHSLKKKQKQLNELPEIDFEAVLINKLSVIANLFQLLKDKVFASEDYKQFFEDNKYWLLPYAAFSYLRDKYKTADFTTWKLHYQYDRKAIEKFCSPSQKHYDKISIHFFTQYHLHLQLKEAHDYANKQGIILKGDIPIGINRFGVDAWMEPELYDMNVQAGAPPDDFAIKGQNWGFPTYNWARMQEDGFLWWKRRFEQMSRYFDAFRIDHILGFFRIWSIPIDAIEGIMGHFVPAIPIHINEFNEKGIWFDYRRYFKPHINDAILWELFGPAEKLFKPYLENLPDGGYQLKATFDTQRKVEAHFAELEKNIENEKIKSGLFDLISNVILFEEAGSNGLKFHFRFNMESTASYRHLEWNTQMQLKELYVNYFFRRQDDFWKHEAMEKLPALKRSTEMLICGEDLGMVPQGVPEVMKQLGILSLEIQRMPKDPKKEFFHPNDAPYLSVVTPSTHDMSTIRGWWEEDYTKIQHFYTHELGQYGAVPHFCDPWINKAIVLQHLYSPAQWCVLQFQDLMGISERLRRDNPEEERINVPSNPKHYWRYRMHISLEDLLNDTEFIEETRGYIDASGRINP